MKTIREQKAALRRAALERRDAMSVMARIEGSMAIADAAATEIDCGPGDIVSGFWPMRSEVDVRPLMASLRDKGARLCLPAIIDKQTIVFREMVRGVELIDMGFGTLGPGPDAAVLQPTVMLVPLAAFDGAGNRIGYGAGYYDRAIARLVESGATPSLFGIAFDCQQVEAVPAEPHDVPLPAIVTESGLRRFARAR